MSLKEIVPDLYAVPLGAVNVFILAAEEGLVLVDTGMAGSAGKVLAAVKELGRQPGDVRHILVSHCHGDHSGSLAALKQATGAPASMHPLDAVLVRQGRSTRFLKPSPGLLNRLLFWLFIRPAPTTVAPAEVEVEVEDGQELPLAGGLRAIHAPGHCAGQLAFLWPRHGGVLFAADAAANIGRLGLSLGYEDLAEGQRSLARLARLDFEVACFGHGGAITSGAAARFRQKFDDLSIDD